jgi:hypothetical protein
MQRPRFAGAALWLALTAGRILQAQETPPQPAAAPPPAPADGTEAAYKEPTHFRPIEANVIINLPSVEVPAAGTLTFLVTHRFRDPLSKGSIDNIFTLDSGNDWGFGLWYAPLKNLDIGFYRTSQNGTYEASAQYELPQICGFGASLRAGEDWRTNSAAYPQKSFFAQAILAYSIGPYARITAVPTYLQRSYGEAALPAPSSPIPGDKSCKAVVPGDPADPVVYDCHGIYENVFNVPVGISIAITHSITIHGEVTPRLGRANASGVGWVATVEKSLLRHRFAFFVGNQRSTTVDQYTTGIPSGNPFVKPKNVYIGFNLFRAWKLS